MGVICKILKGVVKLFSMIQWMKELEDSLVNHTCDNCDCTGMTRFESDSCICPDCGTITLLSELFPHLFIPSDEDELSGDTETEDKLIRGFREDEEPEYEERKVVKGNPRLLYIIDDDDEVHDSYDDESFA